MTRRACELVNEKWLSRLDGAWTPGEETEFAAHLAACASCREAVAADEQVLALLTREKSAVAPNPTSERFLDHLATRALAEVRLAETGGARWRIAGRRLVFVGATAIAGVFLVFAAVSVRQQEVATSSGSSGNATTAGLEEIQGTLGELESDDLGDVEALAASPSGAGQAFELSVGAMNREELKLLDEELHLDLPADFAQIEAAMVAGVSSEGQIDEALDDLTDAELRDVGEQLGKEVGPAARERRGG
ncbi:MAG: hypothetical protein HYY84_16745 [Deltaproteobacteria bacterium]|nr:hypothetical protein [Deltaproteobacteria bacterium]